MMIIVQFLLLFWVVSPAWGQENGWQKEWNKIITAARKEGKVVVRGPTGAEARQQISSAFKAKFGIRVELIAGRTSQLVARLLFERRAQQYTVDGLMTGMGSVANILYPQKMLAPLKPRLILPDVVNPSRWKKGKLWFMDPEEKYVLRLLNSLSALFTINTKYVKREEFKSIKDLLNPKWRGKIAIADPRGSPGDFLASIFYVQLGEEFFKKLYIVQQPVISRNRRQLADWLAHGVHAIAVGASSSQVEKMRREGFPVMAVYSLPDFPGVLTAGSGLLVLLDPAPHPNAARVFANWLASKEGLQVWGHTMESATARNDVNESYVNQEEVPRPGVNYFDGYDWDFTVSIKKDVRVRMRELLE